MSQETLINQLDNGIRAVTYIGIGALHLTTGKQYNVVGRRVQGGIDMLDIIADDALVRVYRPENFEIYQPA